MLVLTRNVGESVIIDGKIKVVLLRIDYNHQCDSYQARIGIQAPDDIIILRQELVNKNICNNKKQS
jgi:carbon storage regulator CsrA